MTRWSRGMSSSRGSVLLAAAVCCSWIHLTCAGPLPSNVTSTDVGLQPDPLPSNVISTNLGLQPGPLPSNVTSTDVGLQPGSCALGDVVYMAGDEFPGSDPCERCACSAGGVRCTRQQCEPRPGCKAVHRPDHCCPTYQCECEQEGRMYGNGEKLVDPQDPCRVCYCQGGEVVCRRIACFVRDDCRPRLVPGRCCPEYDNCPLRGVTAVPGMAPSMSSNVAIEDVGTTPAPAAPEKVKQEITIKEITPVSEIPVLTDVKIKEILPSPSVEVIEYPSSSKSPLIPREATTDKTVATEAAAESDPVSTVDNSPSPSSVSAVDNIPPHSSVAGDQSTSGITEIKTTEDTYPSKISLSTDTINSEIYASNVPVVVSTTSTSPSPFPSTSKAPTEEEDLVPPEHNPAFPPLPDDLSQLSNHEDEISPEPNMDNDHNEHVLRNHEVVSSTVPSSGAATSQKATSTTTTTPTTTTTTTSAPTTTTTTTTTPASTILLSTSEDIKSTFAFSSSRSDSADSADLLATKAYPMLNLRSAIPTEILSVPSSVPEVITGELDEEEFSTAAAQEITTEGVSSTTTPVRVVELSSQSAFSPDAKELPRSKITSAPEAEITTYKVVTLNFFDETSSEQTTSYIPKSNIATEVTSQTELSSLPVETSDQDPPRTSDNIEKEKFHSTSEPLTEATSMKIIPIEGEPITVSKSQSTEQALVDKLETTEFLLTSFGSSESATEPVELIKITTTPEKSEAFIVSSKNHKNNLLNDLIDLVGDVASMSDHTDEPLSTTSVTSVTGISDSEELIPVNAGHKSKNNNFNLNSITEVPLKNKNLTTSNKSKIVEIEDDDESITDSPALNDKSEPTTKRPIIDNVTDDVQKNETSNKDIEIITKSYVPTINRRPTKVVMKKNSSLAVVDETSSGVAQVTASSEAATDEAVAASSELTTLAADVTSAELVDRIEQPSPGGGVDVQ